MRVLHGWRVARALLVSQYALMLEYRAEIVLWALSGVLPLIMLGVWSGSGGRRWSRAITAANQSLLPLGLFGAPVHRGVADPRV